MEKISFILVLTFLFISNTFSTINWTSLPNLTEKKKGSTSVSYEDEIFVFGGFNSSNGFLNTVEHYNLTTSTAWVTLSVLPTPRANLSSVICDTNVYVIGGGNDPGSPGAALDVVQVFDVINKTWDTFPSLNTSRSYHCSEVVGDTIYVFGGGNSTDAFLDSIEKITIGDPSWTTISTTLPSGWKQMASCELSGKIYIVGGQNSGATGDLLIFDPADESITELTSSTTPRFLAGLISTPFRLFFVGGDNAGPLTTVEMYKTPVDTWVTETDLPSSRSDFSITYSSGFGIIITGGFSGVQILDTVLIGELVQPPLKVNSISGKVINSYTKLPVEGVTVSITDQALQETTDSDGNFLFSNLDWGAIEIICDKDGYIQNNYNFDSEPDKDYNIEIELTNDSDRIISINGIVYDELTGLPLPGVKVTLSPDDEIITTDNSGNFLFSDIIWGDKKLTFKKSGFIRQSKSFLGEPNETYSFEIYLKHQTTTEPLIFPNPFNPLRGDLNLIFQNLKYIEVYTISGEKVFEKETNSFSWNGRLQNGDIVSSGIYIFRIVNTNDEVFIRKVVVLK
ncbi:carboxypeptidase-like regulatory domain-containing protein [Candidatus Dependentiae bacterium]|nr:carboxypeptidase-like regulatory domain-containing protein [Candidatus Dependentiae bacterium]